MAGNGFWDDPERVESFARRDPDHRLVELIKRYPDPAAIRVLDLGCAGGRNTRFLIERDFDTIAVDASPKMVEKTQERIRHLCQKGEADERVLVGRMDELGWAPDGRFDLIVALGVYHLAADEAELDRALAESARVLRPEGRVLVSVFSPGTILDGVTLEKVEGTRYVHHGADAGAGCLLNPTELDREMARHGFQPETPTEAVSRKTERGRRVVANGLYVKGNG